MVSISLRSLETVAFGVRVGRQSPSAVENGDALCTPFCDVSQYISPRQHLDSGTRLRCTLLAIFYNTPRHAISPAVEGTTWCTLVARPTRRDL